MCQAEQRRVPVCGVLRGEGAVAVGFAVSNAPPGLFVEQLCYVL